MYDFGIGCEASAAQVGTLGSRSARGYSMMSEVLGEAKEHRPELTDVWCDQILERSLKEVSSLGRPFKYMATCVISRQPGQLDTAGGAAGHRAPRCQMGRDGRERRSRRDGKSKKVRRDRRKGKRGGGRGRSDSYSYSYYSYSESRSRSRRRGTAPPRRDKGSGRGRRSRSRPGRDGPRRGGAGGYIPTSGPRSPSRDGSPANNYIYNMLIDREKARMTRDFAEADKIRDHLRDKGVEILERLGRPSGLDRATGTRGLGREGRGDARQRGL
eukprot:g10773.t1